MKAVLSVVLKVLKAVGKTALKTGNVAFKAGAKIAPKARTAISSVVKFAKTHPNLVKGLLAGAATEYVVDKIDEVLASKGVKTDEVKAFEEYLKANEMKWSDLSDSELSAAFDNLEVDDKDALKAHGNHPQFWFPKDDKVVMVASSSPTDDSDYPQLDDVMIRNYNFDFNDYYLLNAADSPVIDQLAQTIAAYYKGLSLEIPTATQLDSRAKNIINACLMSFRALALLMCKQRFDSGWLSSINNQPGAAGFMLGLYDNSRNPGTLYSYNGAASLPDASDLNGVLQGVIQTPGGSNTPTVTTIPENAIGGFETANASKVFAAGSGLTAEDRDAFYGVNVSNKKWMELISRIKTLPISQASADFAHYLFSGVFQAKQPKVGSGRDVLVFHMNTSNSYDVLNPPASGRRTVVDEIEACLTSAEYYINSDRANQTILNYLGLYKDLGSDSHYGSNSKSLAYDNRNWRSSTFFRTPDSSQINIYDYTEDLYKAMINADMRFRARVNYSIQGEVLSKAFPLLSWTASYDDLYWDRQTEIKPGMQMDLRTKYNMVESGTVASALKFCIGAYLNPSWFMQYTASTGTIRVRCRVPSFGTWVDINAVSGAKLGIIGTLNGPENLVRPNGDAISFKLASLTDTQMLNAFNLQVDSRIRNSAYSVAPMADVDSDYVVTRVPDMNTVYDWQYFNLLLGTPSLKPIIDKLQRIEVAAAGRI